MVLPAMMFRIEGVLMCVSELVLKTPGQSLTSFRLLSIWGCLCFVLSNQQARQRTLPCYNIADILSAKRLLSNLPKLALPSDLDASVRHDHKSRLNSNWRMRLRSGMPGTDTHLLLLTQLSKAPLIAKCVFETIEAFRTVRIA